jgi:hypothetical protein
MTVDPEVVGLTGTVILRIRGGELPGEVEVKVRGGTECLIAYADEPIERDRPVLIWNSRGHRQVDVAPATWLAD